MIDPETARQAVLAWDDALDEWVGGDTSTDYVVQKAGDALAGLVPQLLDHLAEKEQLADLAITEVGKERVALDVERAQRDGLVDDLKLVTRSRDALGERCHQLENERDDANELQEQSARCPRCHTGVHACSNCGHVYLIRRRAAALGDAP